MWWVALAFTLSLMGLFQLLARAGPLEARATLALGFLLIAAHLGAELGKRLRLPRITGFLATGFVVGPAWLGLVRADEVEALRFIAEGAVALVACAAGTELSLPEVRGQRRVLARLSAGALLFPFAAVAAAVLLLSPWFPLTVHQPLGDAVQVALVLGAIAAASSPAVTMAVIDELGAHGPFARAVLGVTIAKDALVIVLFAVVLAVGHLVTSRGALDVAMVWLTPLRLAGSIAAGVGIGYALGRYLRVVTRETPLFLVAVAFVTAEVAALAQLETMLVAVTAGIFVANTTPALAQRLRGELRRGSLPVYVVFFALAGAGIHAADVARFWPWIGVLAGLRAVALRAGTRWAGRSPAVTPDLARHGWLGLISQAGVALGLAAAARRAFPEWGVSLEALVVAMIAVHEVVGPLCFRHGLRAAGQLSEDEHVSDESPAATARLAPGSDGV